MARTVLLLWLVMLSAGCGAPKLLDHPVYPLMGIVGADPRIEDPSAITLDGAEAFAECRHYRLLYSSRNNVLDLIKDGVNAYAPESNIIVYTGGFTSGRDDIALIEREYRSAIAMYAAGKTRQKLTAADTRIVVDMGDDTEWPFHASTAEVSNGDNSMEYCFWIRIDDECMKVTGSDAKAKRLTVDRGFAGTAAAAHTTGAVVLTPVYLGGRETLGNSPRHSNSWPNCPEGEGLRYAFDPASEATARYKAQFIIDMMQLGYDGAWWDTFQPATYNLCDPIGRRHGRSVFPYNFAAGVVHDGNSYLEAMKLQTQRARAFAAQAAGRDPFIAANNLSGNYAICKTLIRTPTHQDLLNGFCSEDSFIRPGWTQQVRREWDFSFEALPQNQWERNVTQLSDAARTGLEVYAMIGPAGYVMRYFHPGQSNRATLERFGWASFLLTVTKERTTFFGMPLIVTQADKGYEIVPLADFYFYPIGDPAETKTLADYKQGDQPVWMRRFEHGIALVSRSDEAQQVTLPEEYLDPATGQTVSEITLAGYDGAVLVKQ